MMFRLGILALVGSGFLAYMSYTEGVLAMQSSAKAEEISLKALIARGSAGNAHIVLTDYVLCANLAHEFDKANATRWTKVWIPVVPADPVNMDAKEAPSPNNVQALIFSTSVANAQELEHRLNKPKLQGLVTNRIASLDSGIRNILQQTYPGTDFDKCLIIQEGRTPSSIVGVLGFAGGAVLALIVSLAFFLGAWRMKK